MAVAFDPVTKFSRIELSNNNLTATAQSVNDGRYGWVYVDKICAGKTYAEFLVNRTNGYRLNIGAGRRTVNVQTISDGSQYNGNGYYYTDGVGDTSDRFLPPVLDGDTYMIAVNVAASRMWIGRNGEWFRGDPAQGTGGTQLNRAAECYMGCSLMVRPTQAGQSGTNQATLRPTTASQTYPAPDGFSALGDEPIAPAPAPRSRVSVMFL